MFLFLFLSVVALDRANAEDALLPIPKVFEGRKRNETSGVDDGERMTDGLVKSKGKKVDILPRISLGILLNVFWCNIVLIVCHLVCFCSLSAGCADDIAVMEVDTEVICMEDRLRSLGLLSETDDTTSKSMKNSAVLEGINLEAQMPQKKVHFLPLFFFEEFWGQQIFNLLMFW